MICYRIKNTKYLLSSSIKLEIQSDQDVITSTHGLSLINSTNI